VVYETGGLRAGTEVALQLLAKFSHELNKISVLALRPFYLDRRVAPGAG
jgi:hypothetical protein